MAAISPLGSGDAVHSGLAEDGETTVRRILHVEDDESVAELVSSLLSSRGFRVVSVGSADEAIRMLETEPYNVVITDIGLPGRCSGCDVARKARSVSTLVFIMSGQDAIDSNVECDGFIAKPFNIREVVATIINALAT